MAAFTSFAPLWLGEIPLEGGVVRDSAQRDSAGRTELDAWVSPSNSFFSNSEPLPGNESRVAENLL
eukprot:12519501-Heterocapsa_arctica.AAC.1